MKKRVYGTGSLIWKGRRWIYRWRENGVHRSKAILDPVTGMPVKKKSEAEKIAFSIRAKGSNVPMDPGQVRLSDLDEAYLESFESTYSENMIRNRRTWMRRLVAFFPTVADVTHERLGSYIEQRKAAGAKNSTINRELTQLRRLLNWAKQTGKIEKNPMDYFRLLPEPHHRERVLDADEIRRLKATLEKPEYAHVRHIVLIALHCGLRRGEILSLRWEHLGNQNIYLLRTESGKRRIVPVPRWLWQKLMEAQKNNQSEWLFPSEKALDKPIQDPKRALKSLFADAGISDATFHDLRHTAATWMLKHGADLNVVRDILGHASIATTQRYLNAMEEQKRKAVEWG